MDATTAKQAIGALFAKLCLDSGRCGVIAAVPAIAVRLLPEQEQYLSERLGSLGRPANFTAVSVGLLYREDEMLAVPATWQTRTSSSDRWNEYARAYRELNELLNEITHRMASEFGGVSEPATLSGWAGTVHRVEDYFAHCVSHRAFAAAADVGWRGRHGLIVTPEAGPALRFATVFLPFAVEAGPRELAGCGDCQACVEVCPILRRNRGYREGCRRRLRALGLADEVCGICVRVCWSRITARD